MELTREQIEVLGEGLFNKYEQVKYKIQDLKSTVQNGVGNIAPQDIALHQETTQKIINELFALNTQLVDLYNANITLKIQGK